MAEAQQRPNIHLHIDRIALEGISLNLAERKQFQAALESELTQLLTHGGLSSALSSGAALASLSTLNIHMTTGEPTALGQEIGRAIYGGIGNETSRE
jgi:hypothetical protein